MGVQLLLVALDLLVDHWLSAQCVSVQVHARGTRGAPAGVWRGRSNEQNKEM